jgi:hypothetical protein
MLHNDTLQIFKKDFIKFIINIIYSSRLRCGMLEPQLYFVPIVRNQNLTIVYIFRFRLYWKQRKCTKAK